MFFGSPHQFGAIGFRIIFVPIGPDASGEVSVLATVAKGHRKSANSGLVLPKVGAKAKGGVRLPEL
jgi:hypothetical protein